MPQKPNTNTIVPISPDSGESDTTLSENHCAEKLGNVLLFAPIATAGLDAGNYNYQGCAANISGNWNCTETRIITIQSIADTTPPILSNNIPQIRFTANLTRLLAGWLFLFLKEIAVLGPVWGF